jgi:ATP-binding cassette subfamily B protein
MIEVVKQTNKTRLTQETLKLYAKAAWKYPYKVVAAHSASIVWTLTQDIAVPFLIAKIIDTLAQQTPNYSQAYSYFWMIAGLMVINFTAARLSFIFRNPLLASALRDLSVKSFKSFERQEYSFFANSFIGSLVARNNRFISTFKDLLDVSIFQGTTICVQFIAPVVILSTRSILLSIVFVLAAVLLSVVTFGLGKYKTPHLRRASAADSVLTGSLADALTNSLATKVFARSEYETSLYTDAANNKKRLYEVQMKVSERIRALRTLIIVGFQVIMVGLLIWLTQQQKISVGTILLAQFYLVNLTVSLWNVNRVAERTEEALADSAEMTEVILRAPLITDSPDAKELAVTKGKIELRDLQFNYDDGTKNETLFTNLNLVITPGQKVGLVGPSGGGKTTITKLLLRFMDIQAGVITVDEQDITSVTQESLRSSIAYVPQEPLLFHRSIKENIAYGKLDATHDEIVAAAKLAHAHDFITKLPEGYETLVGERGVKLSGGEKQRVAIARAMLKTAPILLLDEATSALDSKSEKAIVSALDNLMKGRTTIVIAHRLSTIRKLDRIVVLKDGKIIEDGSHEALLTKKGTYAELWQHQSGEFLAE